MSLQEAHDRPNLLKTALMFDRGIVAIGVILIALALFDQLAFGPVISGATASLISVLPFLLLSVSIAAYATASGADALIARVFTGNIYMMIFAAAVFGALSPFCSCGVIPIIAALLTMGVPLASVMAFWLASPIMDPSMFVMTTGVLGVEFAVAKTLAAFGIGLFGGLGMMVLTRMPQFSAPLKLGTSDGGCAASSVREKKPVAWAFWQDAARVQKFGASALKNGWFLLRWLVLAFILEGLMVRYVPADLVSGLIGGEGVAPIAVATLVGVPAYLNGYAALPLVAGLMEQGMAPGAAISFMVAGGVTCIPAAIAVYALVKKPVFLAYLVFALFGSYIAGLAFQLAVT